MTLGPESGGTPFGRVVEKAMGPRLRVRFTKQPTPRDLEFFALRFLELGETYEVDAQMAMFLVQWGYAVFASDEETEDGDRNDRTREPDNGSNDASV